MVTMLPNQITIFFIINNNSKSELIVKVSHPCRKYLVIQIEQTDEGPERINVAAEIPDHLLVLRSVARMCRAAIKSSLRK